MRKYYLDIMDIRKIMIKKIGGALFLIGLVLVIYILLLGMSVFNSLISGAALLIVFATVMIISLIGLIHGNLKIGMINGRKKSGVLFLLSGMFTVWVIGLVLCNGVLSAVTNEGLYKNSGIKVKTVKLVGYVTPIDYQKNLIHEKTELISFRYPEGNEMTIKQIKKFLPDVIKETEDIFGELNYKPLTIFVYPDMATFKEYGYGEQVLGYYLNTNQTLHIPNLDSIEAREFETIFYHEYTHYATDMYMQQHDIAKSAVPAWFEEGVSELIANKGYTSYIGGVAEVSDFHELDKKRTLTGSDYFQSYYTVGELVLEYGKSIIPNLFRVSKKENFYQIFEEITGTNLTAFQEKIERKTAEIDSLLNQAKDFSGEGDVDKAEAVLLEAINLSPENKNVKNLLIHIYLQAGKLDEARELLLKSEEITWMQQFELTLLMLINHPDEALSYAIKTEKAAKQETIYGDRATKLVAIIKKINSNDPISGYEQLFKEDLIDYSSVEAEMFKKLKKEFPNDFQRIKNN